MTTPAERETLPSASTLISGMTKLLSRGDDAAHELGSIRATLLVNFGEAAKVNRYGLAIKDEGSTHDILMAVLKHLASPIASAKADNELRCFVCHREMTRCTCGKGEMLPCDICRKPACAVQCGNCCHILCPDCEPGNHLDEGCRQLWPTPAATSDGLPQEPAGRELPDGPGFWQRYGEKWVIRQHTESMFFGCHCDANGYLGRTIAVLPKGGWRRTDAGDAEELAALRAAAAWIREHHNGFDPAAREAMDMAKPRTLVEALEQLEAEHEWLLNDAIQKLADAQAELAEACRRLKVLEPLSPNIAENLQVVESDGDFDFVLIRIPLAQAREMLAALTWEEPNDG